MAVSIRLRREGAKNSPYYKVVVADSRSPRDGKFIEIVGTYDPKKKDHNSTVKLDRIEHWISKGAQPSDTVRSLVRKNRQVAANPQPAPAAPTEAPKAVQPAPVAPSVEVSAPAPAAPEAAAPEAPEAAAPEVPEAAPSEISRNE